METRSASESRVGQKEVAAVVPVRGSSGVDRGWAGEGGLVRVWLYFECRAHSGLMVNSDRRKRTSPENVTEQQP